MTAKADPFRRINEHTVRPTGASMQVNLNIADALNLLLADVFTVFLKTKNFHWNLSEGNRDGYLSLLDEHGCQLFAITDDLAKRVHSLGGTAIRSVGEIARCRRITDNDAEFVSPSDKLKELRKDERSLGLAMRAVCDLSDRAGDLATVALLENCMEDSYRRGWFLREAAR